MNSKSSSLESKKFVWDVRKYTNDKELNFIGPKLIGYYSVNQSRELVEDLSQLKYMVKQTGTTCLDLKLGVESTKSKEYFTKHQPFFEYLSRHEDVVDEFESSALNNVGFIMSRGSLIHIGRIPYNRNKKVIFEARLLNGAIYINRQMEVRESTDHDGWGHKFRQYMLSSSTKCEPEADEPVNQNQEFNGVFNFKLGNNNILYISEIDSISANSVESREDISKDLDEKSIIGELNSRKFVKLATSLITDNSPNFAKYKSLQYWLKCFYATSEELYVGFKNESGIVKEIKNYSVDDLKNMGYFWSSDTVLRFSSEFLTFVKRCFADKIPDGCDMKNLPEIKLYFQYMPRYIKGANYTFIEIIPASKDNELPWLPEWYIEKKISKND